MATPLAWTFIALSLFVLFTTFPGRTGRVLAPGLLPVFGTAFAIIYLAVQCGLLLAWRSRWGIVAVSAVGLLGAGLGGCGRAMDLWGAFAENDIGYARYMLVSAACAGGIAFGAGILKGWICRQR